MGPMDNRSQHAIPIDGPSVEFAERQNPMRNKTTVCNEKAKLLQGVIKKLLEIWTHWPVSLWATPGPSTAA